MIDLARQNLALDLEDKKSYFQTAKKLNNG